MKTWFFWSLTDWRLEDVATPSPGEGEVLVAIRVVQASVTHTTILQGGPSPRGDDIQQTLKEKGPLQLFGNEFSGEVKAVGPGVTRFKVGDRVACIKPWIACGHCALCRSGLQDYCKAGPGVGWDLPGCFAEYGLVPESTLIGIPETISFQAGACIESLNTPMGAVAVADLNIGDTVAILGTGSIGFGILQIARVCGAGKIYTTARRKEILSLAKEMGADEVISAVETDPYAAILELTGGVGVDIVFECAAGDPAQGLAGRETMDQALQIVRNGGKIVQASVYAGPLGYDERVMRRRGIHWLPPRGITRKEEDHIIYLMSKGQIKVEPMITHCVRGLERLPEAIKITSRKRDYGAIYPCQVIVS